MTSDLPHFKFVSADGTAECTVNVPWLVQNGNPIDDTGNDMILQAEVLTATGEPLEPAGKLQEGMFVGVDEDPAALHWTGQIRGVVKALELDGSFELHAWDGGYRCDVSPEDSVHILKRE